jgi:hypothetical protein
MMTEALNDDELNMLSVAWSGRRRSADFAETLEIEAPM